MHDLWKSQNMFLLRTTETQNRSVLTIVRNSHLLLIPSLFRLDDGRVSSDTSDIRRLEISESF